MISRHRGAVDATHAGADATVIEARIPHDEYPKFAAALGGVGRREPERETDLPAEVRVTIRLE